MVANRNRYRWNINECLRLQREYELLQLPLDKIAALHGRTVCAIMNKLDSEGFANYNDLYKQYYSKQQEYVQQDVNDHDDNNHSDYVDNYSEDEDDDTEAYEFDPYDFKNNLLALQKQVNNFVGKFTKKSYTTASI
jgi:hypothetical protein